MKYQKIALFIGLVVHGANYAAHKCCPQAQQNHKNITLSRKLGNSFEGLDNAHYFFNAWINYEKSGESDKDTSAQDMQFLIKQSCEFLRDLNYLHMNYCHDSECKNFEEYGLDFSLLLIAVIEQHNQSSNSALNNQKKVKFSI